MKSFIEFLEDLTEMSSGKYKSVARNLATKSIPNAAASAAIRAATQLKGSGKTVVGLNSDKSPIYSKSDSDEEHLAKHLATKAHSYDVAIRRKEAAETRERKAAEEKPAK